MQYDWNLFVKHIVTDDKIWIDHYDPELHKAKHAIETYHFSKVQASAGKVMCTILCDAEGVLLIDFMPRREIVYYADLLHGN